MSEVLSRLGPRTQDLEPTDGPSPSDLSAAMAGLERPAYLMARAFYCQDDTVLDELSAIAVAQASKFFVRRNIPYPGFIRNLTSAAIYQCIQPPPCRRCSGRGHIYAVRARESVCERCNGTGRGRTGGETVRLLTGLSHGQWRLVYKQSLQVEALIQGWLSDASRHVNSRLTGQDV